MRPTLYAPPEDLADYVACFWKIEASQEDVGSTVATFANTAPRAFANDARRPRHRSRDFVPARKGEGRMANPLVRLPISAADGRPSQETC